MTKESQVSEGNKLIDTFRFGEDRTFDVRLMKYHSSWDWLMPVVQKISDTSQQLDSKYHTETENYKQFYELQFHKLYIWTDIETVWEAVVQFIQWYNQKHQP